MEKVKNVWKKFKVFIVAFLLLVASIIGYSVVFPPTPSVGQLTLTLRPNAAGTYQEWSVFGSPPSHWQGTSDQSDGTGVAVGETTSRETENLANTTQTGTIVSITAYIRAMASGSSTAESAKIRWRTHATDYESAAKSISRVAFTDYSEVRTVNPNTGVAWTWDEVNVLETGVRASTLAAEEIIYVSEFWIVISYTGSDTTPPTYSNVGTNTTRSDYNTQDFCEFYVYCLDDIGLSGAKFGTNNTGTWQNDTWTDPWTGEPTSGWYNVTKTLTNATGTDVSYQFWFNDTSNNRGTTGLQTFRIWGVEWRTFGFPNATIMASGYVIGDGDNDGLNELFSPYGTLLSKRDWTGTTYSYSSAKTFESRVSGCDICDSNGDGQNEVVVMLAGHYVYVLNWTAEPPTTLWSKSYTALIGYDILGADVNGDGIDDLILSFDQYGFPNNPELMVLIWNNTSQNYDEYPYNHPDNRLNPAATVGDVDQDGKKEIIAGMYITGNPQLCVLEWNGTGIQLEWNITLESAVYGVWIGDNDSDQYLEFSVAVDPISVGGELYNQSVYIFGWNGSAYVQEAKITVQDESLCGIAEALTVNDIDNDYIMETVFISNKIYVFYWNGTKYVQKNYSPIELPAEGWAHIFWGYWFTPMCQIGDTDNDGKSELYTNNYEDECFIYIWSLPYFQSITHLIVGWNNFAPWNVDVGKTLGQVNMSLNIDAINWTTFSLEYANGTRYVFVYGYSYNADIQVQSTNDRFYIYCNEADNWYHIYT